MTDFSLSDLRNSSVWAVYRLKDKIEMDPYYQREGDIWSTDKRKLLIDTIINQFDVPKIYLHKFSDPKEAGGSIVDFAVIDGKQRLSTIFDFIDGKFPLSSDFEYMRGATNGGEPIEIANFTYADIAKKYPLLKADFDSYPLDIVCIETRDIELIEELFSRLNEAVPLNAPEKRNALPGPLPAAVRELSQHTFFTGCLPFSNKRYRHYDFAAKMLLAADRASIVDTKKAYIDRFFQRGASLGAEKISECVRDVSNTLDYMALVFTERDPLLRQIGMGMLYYYVFIELGRRNMLDDIRRSMFMEFNDRRVENRRLAEDDIGKAEYDLLEFDRYNQSPNDAIAMRFRLGVIDRELFGGRLGTGQGEADAGV